MKLVPDIELECLHPACTVAEIVSVCEDAKKYQVAAVAVPPMFVKRAKEILTGTNVKVSTVIGFPYGYQVIESKLSEIVMAIVDGADELNVMLNLLAIKNNDWEYLARELNHLLSVVRKSGKKIKIILEAGLMSENEIIACCDIYGVAAIDFLQASSGIAETTCSIEKLNLIRKHLADAIILKENIAKQAAGDLITAGVKRIGVDYTKDFDTIKLLTGTVFEMELPANN